MILDLDQLNPIDRQHFLQSAVAPRPVCFASTIKSSVFTAASPDKSAWLPNWIGLLVSLNAWERRLLI